LPSTPSVQKLSPVHASQPCEINLAIS